MKLLIGLSFALVFAPTAFGGVQECDLSIRDGYAAQDLNRILTCLDQRIKTLEGSISELEKQRGSVQPLISDQKGTPSAGMPSPNTVTQEGIAFSLEKVSRSKDKKSVTVVFSAMNTKEDAVGVMFVAPEPSFVDDEATMVSVKSDKDVGGISVCNYSTWNFKDSTYCSRDNDYYKSRYTMLTPNNKVAVLLKFVGESEITGATASFAAAFLTKRESKDGKIDFKTISVSMANLPIGK